MSAVETADSAHRPLRHAVLLACGLLAASATVCIGAYLVRSSPDSWLGDRPALSWSARDLRVVRGSARLLQLDAAGAGQALAVTATDATGTALVTANPKFRSRDHSLIAWDVIDVPEGVTAALLWRNEYTPERLFTRSLNVESGRVDAVTMTGDPNWIGNITGIALALRGSLEHPVLVRGVTVRQYTAAELIAERAAEWLAFEPWTGASINGIVGSPAAQTLPPPLFLACVAGLAILAYVLLGHWPLRILGPIRPGVVAAIFFAAWFALDARWQWNLLRQDGQTIDRYGNRTWRERHLAAEDHVLFAFIENVRAKLPPEHARIFFAADSSYFRGRGAYHLYPYNVYFDPAGDTLPPSSTLRSDDYLVAFQRRNIQFDPEKQLLRWDGGEPIPAELLLAESSGAAFRIR